MAFGGGIQLTRSNLTQKEPGELIFWLHSPSFLISCWWLSLTQSNWESERKGASWCSLWDPPPRAESDGEVEKVGLDGQMENIQQSTPSILNPNCHSEIVYSQIEKMRLSSKIHTQGRMKWVYCSRFELDEILHICHSLECFPRV